EENKSETEGFNVTNSDNPCVFSCRVCSHFSLPRCAGNAYSNSKPTVSGLHQAANGRDANLIANQHISGGKPRRPGVRMNGVEPQVGRLAEFMSHRLLWLLIGSYILAALIPWPGLWLRSVNLAAVADAGLPHVYVPSVLLSFLLFNAGLG